MSALLIRGGRVLDPANGVDAVLDVLIKDGRIARLASQIDADASMLDISLSGVGVLEAGGLVVTPGFVDLHVHLREPGEEHKETVASGTAAAARGGFTSVCAMPNTHPPADTAAVIAEVLAAARGAPARVFPLGAITRGRAGRELAELDDLRAAGAVAFSDDGAGVADAAVARRALEYAADLGLPVAEHCEEPALAAGGVMHEGVVATRLGLRGQPALAEVAMVERDLHLAELSGARLHLCHLSTAAACEAVSAAKARGLAVTAEVTPHHLLLTEASVAEHEEAVRPSTEAPGMPGTRSGQTAVAAAGLTYDTNAKVNPPLRTTADVEACRSALREGIFDAVASDHAPHARPDKLCEFDAAAFGISGLETAFGVLGTLVARGELTLATAIERLTIGPVRAWTLDRPHAAYGDLAGLGTLSEGAPADLALLDPAAVWTVEPERFASKGKNTPLAGMELTGRVVATVLGGIVVHEERA